MNLDKWVSGGFLSSQIDMTRLLTGGRGSFGLPPVLQLWLTSPLRINSLWRLNHE